uniref:Putative prohead protease n=1 Tax=viral metagenome TaxID=1070528 RepID=A0A6M3KRV3_9ZZZZ
MDNVYKVLENCEVKKVGERKYEFIASTSDQDRDGEVIDVNGWDLKNFKKNPVIMFGHDYRSLPIGRATKIGVRDGKLVNNVEFPPEGTYEFADIVERLVGAGFLKTESVGFVPKKWEDGDGGEKTPRRTYTKQELLEISIVPVPSNPNALMNAVEEGVITTKQLQAITEPDNSYDDTEAKKPKEVSQEEIKDEIDYLTLMIDEVGLSDESEESLRELMKRLPADDIAVEIVNNTPIAVDNTANDERLKLIIAQTVKNVIKEIK